MKKLLKSEVCRSREQCMRPTNSAISDQCVDVQSASGSRAQRTGPTGKSVSYVKPTSGKKKRGQKHERKTQTRKPNTHYKCFIKRSNYIILACNPCKCMNAFEN